ncbi:MAG: hypothetical protein QF718_06015 [Phycisphaerales bacterium]|jgi:hypothetical protein|nr:hypothetical protein [Phycisphaerales bacterium]
MEQVKWLRHFIVPLEQAKLTYMVTGSVVSIAKGEPRLTLDVDFVISLNAQEIIKISDCFPDSEYYCPPSEVIQKEMCAKKGSFNVINHETGMKADFFLSINDPLHLWGLEKRTRCSFEDLEFWIAPSEYVIIRKLEYFKDSGSSKHLRDIYGLVKIDDTIDMPWLQKEIASRNLFEQWEQVGV